MKNGVRNGMRNGGRNGMQNGGITGMTQSRNLKSGGSNGMPRVKSGPAPRVRIHDCYRGQLSWRASHSFCHYDVSGPGGRAGPPPGRKERERLQWRPLSLSDSELVGGLPVTTQALFQVGWKPMASDGLSFFWRQLLGPAAADA